MSGRTPLLMAVDAGTGSVRAVLFDTRGEQVAVAQREYTHPAVPGAPGGQSFATETNWNLTTACIRDAIEASGRPAADIAAVATTAMREGMVLYDDNDNALWACPNSDSRAASETAQLIDSGLAERIYATAGDWIAITAPPRLLWLRNHEPELFARVAHLTMLSDWLTHKLTGAFVTEPTIGSSSAMFDLATRTWSTEIVEELGLPASVLPRVLEPGSVAGEVTSEAAETTGLAAGTLVVVGGADTQMALAGLGFTSPGMAAVIGGTFWQATLLTDQPIIDPSGRLRTLCHADPDAWMIEGIGFWCGLAMRWVRDVLVPAGNSTDEAWRELNEAAASLPPGSNGVTAVFSGSMNAKRWLHAAPGFIGIDITGSGLEGRAAMVRSTMEAAAYVVRTHLRLLEGATGQAVSELTFSGGAAKSRLWAQIVADVNGCRVEVPETTESTALGAALCAGVGAGVWADLGAAARDLEMAHVSVAPDEERAALYDRHYDDWRQLYEHQLDAVERNLARPMWSAAGVLDRP